MVKEIEVIYTNFKVINGENPRKVKNQMVRDSSWGTFMDSLEAAEKCCGSGSLDRWRSNEPNLTDISTGKQTDEIFSLEFPKENFDFEAEGVDHFISTIAGDIVLNPSIEEIKVYDFNFKNSDLYSCFPGPNVGLEKLYSDLLAKTLKSINRPILAYTLKPRMGLTITDIGKLYIEAAKAKIDIVEDDERLIDPSYCRFEDRVDALTELQESYDSIYSANITGSLEDARKRLDFAVEKGIQMVKLDVLVSGFETLRQVALYIRDSYDSKIAITVYPDAYRAYRKLSRKFILKMARLCGADIIYAGSPNWARYEQENTKMIDSLDSVYSRHQTLINELERANHIKKSLPTITNDQHPSRMELITAFFRKFFRNHYQYGFFVGGGISGYPGTIQEAVNTCIGCIKHAISSDLDKYQNYKFDQSKFELKNWDLIDV